MQEMFLSMMGSDLIADWVPTCVLHSSLFKMADKSGGDQSPEKIESLQEQSGDREPPDPQINGTTEEEPARGVQPPASGSSKKKKKKKKGKSDGGSSEVLSSESLTSSVAMNLQNLRQLQNLQKSFELLRAGEAKAPKTKEEALRKKYQFWDTQPVPKLGGVCFDLHTLSLIIKIIGFNIYSLCARDELKTNRQ